MLMLLFYVGKNLYAIESSRVVEVIPRVSYREIPQVPEYLAGVFNYRGMIVPIIDLCQLIRGTPSKVYLSTRIAIASYPHHDNQLQYIGIMAERTIETIDKPTTEIKTTGVQASDIQYLGGILMDKKGMIQLIDLENLLTSIPQINLVTSGF
jgi:chemotaxis-related protein WspB